MKITKFEEIVAWQNSRVLSQSIYYSFNDCRDFAFRDQIQRAVVSIMNNIAEGFDRQTNQEFKQFLYISKGSCAEVKSMLYLSIDLGYLTTDESEKCFNLADKISRLLYGLIKSLDTGGRANK